VLRGISLLELTLINQSLALKGRWEWVAGRQAPRM
jgi:hypothetical protein